MPVRLQFEHKARPNGARQCLGALALIKRPDEIKRGCLVLGFEHGPDHFLTRADFTQQCVDQRRVALCE
ncbi:hypothetical protein QDX27_15800, partial [Rhizobium sp. BR 318]